MLQRDISTSTMYLVLSPGSSLLVCTRGKGSLVSNVTPYAKLGRVSGGENCTWARTIFRALWFNVSEKEGCTDCQRG